MIIYTSSLLTAQIDGGHPLQREKRTQLTGRAIDLGSVPFTASYPSLTLLRQW